MECNFDIMGLMDRGKNNGDGWGKFVNIHSDVWCQNIYDYNSVYFVPLQKIEQFSSRWNEAQTWELWSEY